MLMGWLLGAIAIPAAGGLIALLLADRARASTLVGAGSAVAGSLVGLVTVAYALINNSDVEKRWPWEVPFGEFHFALDPLSSVFLLLVFGLGLLGAIYGAQYLFAFRSTKSLGVPWFFYNLLLASMAVVLIARNGMLFLTAWEIMAITSFFLVGFEHERAEVRRAARNYLVAMHVGTAFLLAFFAILAHETGTLDFNALATFNPGHVLASILFLLALVGFGTKAGLIPFHTWLPDADPAAPCHVSALMSAVLVKIGIYGLLRSTEFLGDPLEWWGVLLIAVGMTSGILGVLFALAQRDMKRMLAYSTIENVGIITMGIGIGVWGLSHDLSAVAFLGFTGALLHTVTHGLFKGLLFLGSGAVLHRTRLRSMDDLGGLLKTMPLTGIAFIVGGAAIAGVPLLSGFVSEFTLVTAALRSVDLPGPKVAPVLAIIPVLGLVGALALATFARAIGIAFLGSPRTPIAAEAQEVGVGLKVPMAILAVLTIIIGIVPVLAIQVVVPAATNLSGISTAAAAIETTALETLLWRVTIAALAVAGSVAVLLLLRSALLRGRSVRSALTWGCAYALPSPRMQYTSTSFAEPLIRLFKQLVRPRQRLSPPRGPFPVRAGFASDAPDLLTERLIRPGWLILLSLNARLRWLQQGSVNLYLLYPVIALAVLLVWRFGFAR
ncbi:MAG: oxidoreductase [Chloroflexi bacterium]|nr:oxidoreductase [Chloroflexota bacterium]